MAGIKLELAGVVENTNGNVPVDPTHGPHSTLAMDSTRVGVVTAVGFAPVIVVPVGNGSW
jgi:hypothetical protein